MRGTLAAALLAAALLPFAARADTGASVYCGSVRCITLRAAAGGHSPEQRADWAMGVLNKYLGSKEGRFTTAFRGKEVQILLNGEVMLVVTAADALQEKAKSISALAASWRSSLARAFLATRAQK